MDDLLKKARDEASYYKRLAEETGKRHLQETDRLSQLIARLKRAEDSLREAQTRMISIFDGIDEPVYVSDPDTHELLYCNRAIQNQWGDPGDMKCHEYIHKLDAPCPFCTNDKILEECLDRSYTWEGQNANNGRWYRCIDKAISWPDGRVVRYEMALDITDRKIAEAENKKLEQQLVQAQKMESIGRLAGGMAHDFNNMLAVIMGSASLALLDRKEGDDCYNEMKDIMAAAEQASDLVTQLLTFARQERINARDVRIKAVIDDMAGMLKRMLDKKIKVTVKVKGNCMVRIDKNQIQRALLNVCVNAGDAMPDGGKLTIECREHSFENDRCPSCGKSVSDRYCMIRISDTGSGISREIKSKVSEPFFTTKEVGKGTGLGLSIAHGIIEKHAGHFHISSETGSGTQVTIYLPLSDSSKETREIEEAREVRRGTETILVVDDEPGVLNMTKKVLENLDYVVLLAKDGPEAIRIYKKRGKEIAIVIIDVIMPDMEGDEVFLELKRLDPSVKAIMSSGYNVNDRADEFSKIGVEKFVRKPFDVFTLCSVIGELLDE